MQLTKENYFVFSGGEVHCKVPDGSFEIVMQDYTMNGFMALAEHVEVLKRSPHITINVVYPYFPYARQDRIINQDEPFSLKVFCQLFNSLGVDSVTVYDPHSDVVGALLNNCRIIEQHVIAKQTIPAEFLTDSNMMFVSPDAGAYKKVAKIMPNDYRIVIGTKTRGVDGRIIRTGFYSPVDLKGMSCVIIDDICDGGRTFIELGKELRRKGVAKLFLCVTHGIFSNGLEDLKKYFDNIYTTNTFPNVEDEFLKVTRIL